MKNPNIKPGLKALTFAMTLACAIALTGCLSRPPLNQQTFAFGLPDVAATNAAAGNGVLVIRKLQIAAPFEGPSFIYRTGEFSYVSDSYAGFLESPEEELVAPIRAWLCRQGGFSTVVGTGSALKPDTVLEINVSELFGDYRQPANPKAVLTMQFLFFKATNGLITRPLFQKEYSRSIVIGKPNAAALMKGWDQALTEILSGVESDYRQAKMAE